mmetsp:Transcript_33612/g.132537  ORF Transcript_33612/g.132537 Transcript_33612/m.132537 type:complete len:98 (-) Transcript_33612:8-301(-)
MLPMNKIWTQQEHIKERQTLQLLLKNVDRLVATPSEKVAKHRSAVPVVANKYFVFPLHPTPWVCFLYVQQDDIISSLLERQFSFGRQIFFLYKLWMT